MSGPGRIVAGALAALVGIIFMIASGAGFELALAIGVLWLASLFLVQPPNPDDMLSDEGHAFDEEAVEHLLEPLSTPLLFVEHMRVTRANAAAREVLGAHIVGQDARVALRHPEAIAMLHGEDEQEVRIQGLVSPRSVWDLRRRPVGKGRLLLELVNRSSEADLSRAHTDFVANASHELRTPLSSILGYVEILADPEAKPEKEKRLKFLAVIEREARRMQSLVSDLMSLSRVEASKHERPAKPLDLASLVQRAARDGAGPDRQDRVTFRAPRDFTVLGDPEQLEQVVRNLVDNGLKYGDTDKMVSVTLSPGPRDSVIVAVEDRGPGIPPEHVPHLTRRFYRTDPGRSRASGGTGLGLAIVKHIVERHQGRLDIDSVLGEGTTVRIRLPTIDASPV
jgi:two-component system phosphate regulon sensor histidine kinase PhoR